MKTERLHYDDPLCLALDATVVAHTESGGEPAVVLDRTVFYPESGGQMADHGTLGGLPVSDVQLDPEGRVHHHVSGLLPPLGATVALRVDEARRREHMALHSGQHALSHALLELLEATTVSSRLGASACTIDVDRAGLSLDDVRRAEDRVNALIDEDRPVRQFFPTDAELEGLRLRKPPPETDRVRVVDIDGFDITPCGGTHVTHTAQIELLFVSSVERYKGGTRVTFTAGPRARRALREQSDLLRRTAEGLRCAPAELFAIVDGLKQKLEDARAETGAVRARLADVWADRLRGPSRIVRSIEGGDAPLLSSIAERLATGSTLVALAAPHEEGTDVLLARGPECGLKCGELLRAIASACGGRGGGRPEHAQGRLPAGIDLAALLEDALGAA